MGLLDRFIRPDPQARAAFERAAAAVDRELAANIELSAMFDQTHQGVIFENAEFARHTAVLRASAPDAFAHLNAVYAAIPATESAMERRGPAATLRPADRALIEGWEGDVRDAQVRLRAALAAPPPSAWSRALARLGGGKQTGR
jgi:hypothetical protein